MHESISTQEWSPLLRALRWALVAALGLAYASGTDGWFPLYEVAGYVLLGLVPGLAPQPSCWRCSMWQVSFSKASCLEILCKP